MRTIKIFISGAAIALSLTSAFAQQEQQQQYPQRSDDFGTPSTVGKAGYCPNLTMTMQRGATDATTNGQVSQLQRFLIERSYLEIDQPTGRIAGLTAQAIKDFQADANLPAFGIVGSLTRAAIAQVCAGGIVGTVQNSGVVSTTNPATPSTLPPIPAATTSPYVVISTVSANTIAGEYKNLPVLSTSALTIFNVTANQQMAQGASVASGGNNVFTITLGADITNGSYRIRIINTATQQVIAQSDPFDVNRQSTVTTVMASYGAFGPKASISSAVSGTSVTIIGGNSLLPLDNAVFLTFFGASTFNLTPTRADIIGLTFDVPNVAPGLYAISVNRRVNGVLYTAQNTIPFTILATSSPATVNTLPNITLTATSEMIQSGLPTTLTWNVTGTPAPTECYARNLQTGGYEKVASSGSRTLYPTVTTTYRVDCVNSVGTRVVDKTIVVTPNTTTTSTVATLTVVSTNATTLTGSYTNLSAGAQILLVNRSTGTQMSTPSVNIANANGSFTMDISSLASGVYVLRAINSGGIIVDSPVTFSPTTTSSNAPTIGLSASAYTIQPGQSTQIAWNTTGATSCTAYYDGKIESVSTQGLVVVTPTSSVTNYRLVCTNGSASSEKTISITSMTTTSTNTTTSAPVVTLTGSTSITSGNGSTLSWSATGNPTSCTASNLQTGGSESVTTPNSRTVYPTITTSYRVACTNSVGTGSADITVNVTSNTTSTNTSTSYGPPTIGLSAQYLSITAGQKSTVAWDVYNADSCTAYVAGVPSTVGLHGVQDVYPTVTTTYRLVCINGSTSGEKSVTISVTPVATSSGSTNTTATTNTTSNQPSINTSVPTVGLSTQYSSTVAGASNRVAWDVVNADSCMAYVGGNPTSVGLHGNEPIYLTQTTNYRLVCTNSAGSTEKSVTVTITQ